MEMIRDVEPGAGFGEMAFAAAWVVLMERDALRMEGDAASVTPQVRRNKRVLEAFVGGDFGPLVDYARDQLVVIRPGMMDSLAVSLDTAVGDVGRMMAAQRNDTQVRYEFWERLIELAGRQAEQK